MRARLPIAVVAGLALVLPAPAPAVTTDATGGFAGRAASAGARVATPAAPRPLAGRTVVLDPGHQLGNATHPRQIDRPVVAGPGERKPCNTTGTATDSGYPEATFNWRVAQLAERRLERAGARVVLTRSSNSRAAWGPCVDARGRAGAAAHADLTVSIHADGSYAPGARGFHVIAPASLRGWTDDIAAPSMRLALTLRAALGRAHLKRANYIAGGDVLDVRSDLGTLNLSDVPIAMVELGNMRNAREAHRMRSKAGRARYARALVDGITRYLTAH
jgi:N-acetylmuramoyl-L-alanine amidase